VVHPEQQAVLYMEALRYRNLAPRMPRRRRQQCGRDYIAISAIFNWTLLQQ